MIPRIHKRGSSFKGVCAYILHDPEKKTRDRVDWVMTQHLGENHPEDAWKRMHETWRERTALKIIAGVPTTGRDNTNPVLHYTLAWHKDDKPAPEHMQKMALESLKVLGLAEHQAVIAAHTDKVHLHVHVVVNTVHPETGKTAALKYTKEKFSKWAEAYEREHGIHCEERVRNNAERERHAQARKTARRMDPTDLLMNRKGDAKAILMAGPEPKARKPYVPVKHKETSRKQWFEKNEITDRMKAIRASLDAELKTARDMTWLRHNKERDTLDARTEATIDAGRRQVQDRYRPRWRNLYWNQKKEARHVERLSGDILERAALVYRNRERLGGSNGPLTLRRMLPLIRSAKKLQARVGQIHEQERRELAREAKSENKAMADVAMRRHRAEFDAMRDRQMGERQSERDAQTASRRSVSFALAKAALIKEHEAARPLPEPRPLKRPAEPMPLQQRFREATAPPAPAPAPPAEHQFRQAANGNARPALSRAEQIKRDMEEWRRRNQGRDFGR
ncbi:MAG: relaxase/mobilization nuclease domain-containing protein, partial [Prosthecobacter sp.]|nr:relaxase/mobilization nuclease domain-containing protein [Prosthecobacter sp.]